MYIWLLLCGIIRFDSHPIIRKSFFMGTSIAKAAKKVNTALSDLFSALSDLFSDCLSWIYKCFHAFSYLAI